MRLIVTVLLGVAAVAHADVSADRIESARQRSLDEDYQPQLPRYEHPDVGFEGGGGSRPQLGNGEGSDGMYRDADGKWHRVGRAGNGTAHGDDRRWVDTRHEEHQGQEANGFMQMVMWGLLIVLAVLFIVWIASELTKYGGDAEVAPSESQASMQAAVDAIIEKPLGDADELARRGEYAEAIHTLLLRTLQELVKSSAVRVAPAMTSREILARVPLLADAREAFAGLITAVEITHFGDEPANAADYQRCREQFNVFAQALRGARPAQAAAA